MLDAGLIYRHFLSIFRTWNWVGIGYNREEFMKRIPDVLVILIGVSTDFGAGCIKCHHSYFVTSFH